MSSIDSLPEGYEYCNCHPETCVHENGVRYVGKRKEFEVDLKKAEKVRNNPMYVDASIASKILCANGIELLPYIGAKQFETEEELDLYLESGERVGVEDNSHIRDIGDDDNIRTIRYCTWASPNFSDWQSRYSIVDLYKFIERHKQSERFDKLREFLLDAGGEKAASWLLS